MSMGTHGTTPVPQLISDGEVELMKCQGGSVSENGHEPLHMQRNQIV